MPTVTEQPISALAFCIDGRCPGYNQQPVEAIRRVNEFSYVELGGDLPGIERSTIDVLFVNDEDRVCPECGKPRLVSEQERPEYANVSGQDPMALFQTRQNAERVREVSLEAADLRAQVAQQAAQMERMASLMERQGAMLEELQARPRGPGRPRSVPDKADE